MRQILAHVDGRAHRGAWETWHDAHDGQMIRVVYRQWSVQGPAGEEDPERIAQVCLNWCVERAVHGVHPSPFVG